MAKIRRILVPTDFSAASDAALVFARDLAGQFGASLELLHVFEDPFLSGAFVGDGTVMMPADLRQALETAAREQLASRHTAHAGSLPGSSAELVLGSAAKGIVERAAETHADLIVMGTHGRSGLGHLLIGSVAERVVRTARVPVLTVPDPERLAATQKTG
jgi:nucleotide-binding universal stress UspA family protein